MNETSPSPSCRQPPEHRASGSAGSCPEHGAADETAGLSAGLLDQVAHDLRSPLGSILIWVKLLRQAPAGGVDVPDGLDMIERSAAAMVARLDELAATCAAISAAPATSPAREAVDLAALVCCAAGALTKAAEARGVAIVVVAACPAPAARVMADPRRLRQALDHLLAGMLRDAPQGASIEVLCGKDAGEVNCTFTLTLAGTLAGDRGLAPGTPASSRRATLDAMLARRIIELQGGSLRRDEGERLVTTVRLPGADAAPHATASDVS